jgi:hypothetical protein
MTVDEIIWAMTLYIGAQYLFSRYVASCLNREDPAYFDLRSSDGKFKIGMKTSLGITEMIFDTDLPLPEYSKALKNKIYLARSIYGLTVPILFLFIYI